MNMKVRVYRSFKNFTDIYSVYFKLEKNEDLKNLNCNKKLIDFSKRWWYFILEGRCPKKKITKLSITDKLFVHSSTNTDQDIKSTLLESGRIHYLVQKYDT